MVDTPSAPQRARTGHGPVAAAPGVGVSMAAGNDLRWRRHGASSSSTQPCRSVVHLTAATQRPPHGGLREPLKEKKREFEMEAVARVLEIASYQFLDFSKSVVERVTVHVEDTGGR